ncbi:hypothetical protein BD289DRAFT_428252 [Coniella lustricola]|uniref:Uncharacterized protein n=1 Tax=Coniella lustricola TaxID=2025994 RepID=A0A2T3AE89_9PEZI|nr:hypothetical protein BD289DRAFT_428252 [Coniella lustricola]
MVPKSAKPVKFNTYKRRLMNSKETLQKSAYGSVCSSSRQATATTHSCFPLQHISGSCRRIHSPKGKLTRLSKSAVYSAGAS